MVIKLIKGDLFEHINNYDIVIHGCNCFNKMGAGFAKEIKTKYPEAYQADKHTKRGDKTKLGTFSKYQKNGLIILNCYTQYYYGRRLTNGHPPFDYDAFIKVLKLIRSHYGKRNFKFCMPKIGSGLAGGDW